MQETYGHRSAHAERIVRWKAGDRTSAFPAGTLRGHTFLGMPLDVPELGAILGAPHPSREEVEADLAEKRAQRAKMEAAQRRRERVLRDGLCDPDGDGQWDRGAHLRDGQSDRTRDGQSDRADH
jgi:hypothetical protein